MSAKRSFLESLLTLFTLNRQREAISDSRIEDSMPPAGKPIVKLDTATGLMVEKYFLRGKLHRDGDKPAVIEYEPESKRVLREQYFQHGALHREDGKPAFIEYSAATGRVVLEVFFRNGRLYRNEQSPSAIDYDRVTGEPIQYDQRRPGSPPITRKK